MQEAVFLGSYSSEPVGDYFAGTNHILPTAGTARFMSSLSVYDFIKDISVINYSKKRLEKTARHIIGMAELEGLTAHSKCDQSPHGISSMPNFIIKTFGCKTNQYESEGIREALTSKGWNETEIATDSTIGIINTCSVTSRAGASARNAINKLIKTNPNIRIFLPDAQ